MSYTTGQSVTLSVVFSHRAGQAADPAVVNLIVQQPDLSKVTYVFGSGDNVIVHDGVGAYHAQIRVVLAGTYAYRWEGVDTASSSAVESRFSVLKSFIQ